MRIIIFALCGVAAALLLGADPALGADAPGLPDLAAARAAGTQRVALDRFTPEGLADWVLEGSGTMDVAGGALVVRAIGGSRSAPGIPT